MRSQLLNSGARAGIAALDIDSYQGARAMTRHLLATGHRRIAFIAGPDDNFDAHEYVAQAAAQGAAALLVARRVESPLPQVVVEDTQRALGEVEALEALGIDPTSKLYTELPAMPEIFERMQSAQRRSERTRTGG